jgi:hypothetical protein
MCVYLKMNKETKKLERFGGRLRLRQFLESADPDTVKVNFRKDGEIVAFDENDPITIGADDGYEFILTGDVNGKNVATRVYPVTDRSNGAWCKLSESGILDGFVDTSYGVPVDIDGPICKRIGTRSEVLNRTARKTSGGLTIGDLVQVGDDILSHIEYNKIRNRQLVEINPPDYLSSGMGLKAPGAVGFNDIADGLSLQELYNMATQPQYAGVMDIDVLDDMMGARVSSLLSRVMGFEKLAADGTPYNPSGPQKERYANVVEFFDRNVYGDTTRGLGPIDSVELVLGMIRRRLS